MDTKAFEEKICQRMKELRLSHSLTQEDFEVEGGISSRHIRDMELLNKTNVELTTIFKFCQILKIHPRELFDIEVPWAK
jgi:transcriptional regulator with XRE-family HTH domain